MRPTLVLVLCALASAAFGQELFHLDHGHLRYVALAAGGVEVVDRSDPQAPRVLGRFAEGRIASRMLIQDNTLVLLESREEATVWSLANPGAPARTGPGREAPPAVAAPEPAPALATPAPGPKPAAARTRVQSVRGGSVIFEAGEAQGFAVGARVRVLSQRLERRPDLATGEMRDQPSNAVSAVVRIEDAQADRSMARLGRGDVAVAGDVVELTDAPLSESIMFPRRSPFSVLVGFHLRPFLGLEAGTAASGTRRSFGLLGDLEATWYADGFPLSVSASVSPVGFSIGAVEGHYPVTVTGGLAYATDWFEIGLGAGAMVGNQGPCFSGPLGPESCEVNTGFTINQSLRLGALDGLNLSWRSSIFSRPDRFVFGVGRGAINVPFTRQLGLFGAGGGGENGWAFGELGLRTYVNGIGARGTVILSASLGYAAIFDGPSREQVGGPSVAFGAEWRL